MHQKQAGAKQDIRATTKIATFAVVVVLAAAER